MEDTDTGVSDICYQAGRGRGGGGTQVSLSLTQPPQSSPNALCSLLKGITTPASFLIMTVKDTVNGLYCCGFLNELSKQFTEASK